MIQSETKLIVADNSGANIVRCIKVLGGTGKRSAGIGDLIKVSVQSERKAGGRIKKGQVYTAVVVRTAKGIVRSDGSTLVHDDNACVLLNKQKELIATRIFGPIPREIKDKFNKIITLAEEVV